MKRELIDLPEKKIVNVRMDNRIYEILKYWNKERKTQEVFCTRSPIYIIETPTWEQTSSDYATESFLIFRRDEVLEYTLKQVQRGDLKQALADFDYEISKEDLEVMEESEDLEDVAFLLNSIIEGDRFYVSFGIQVWKPTAYFFTLKEAQAYQEYQSHNLRDGSRIYAWSPGYSNRSTLSSFLEVLDTEEIFNPKDLILETLDSNDYIEHRIVSNFILFGEKENILSDTFKINNPAKGMEKDSLYSYAIYCLGKSYQTDENKCLKCNKSDLFGQFGEEELVNLKTLEKTLEVLKGLFISYETKESGLKKIKFIKEYMISENNIKINFGEMLCD